MLIQTPNPILQTYLFGAIFLASLLFIKKKDGDGLFPLSLSNELKGFAIIAIVLSHIGYFLAEDHRFLFPFSILAGVGVNIFLFLSGFGLTVSSLRKNQPLLKRYWSQVSKIFVPLWIVLSVLFLADYFILDKTYSPSYIFRSFAGFYPQADLYLDINSPLWYLTPTLFYYLIFPLVFIRRAPYLSAGIIYATTWLILKSEPEAIADVVRLYEVHTLAFPLGIVFAYASSFSGPTPKALGVGPLKRFVAISLSLLIAAYLAYYSGIGQDPWQEEWRSLVTMAAIIAFFIIKKTEFRLFALFGSLSYEIYLIHWPIMYRYDFLYKTLPAWLATLAYLFIFVLLGKSLARISRMTICRKTS